MIIFLAWFAFSCGYRAIGSFKDNEIVALSIPLISSDEDGRLRDNLAVLVASTRKYKYTSFNSRYQLLVKIESDETEHIGYMWDRDSIVGERLNKLYPSEGRRSVVAKVIIIDTITNKDLIEPFTVTVNSDFDFVNPTSIKNIEFTDTSQQKQTSLQYSLGQLDSQEGSSVEVAHPLFDKLAEKIIRFLL